MCWRLFALEDWMVIRASIQMLKYSYMFHRWNDCRLRKFDRFDVKLCLSYLNESVYVFVVCFDRYYITPKKNYWSISMSTAWTHKCIPDSSRQYTSVKWTTWIRSSNNFFVLSNSKWFKTIPLRRCNWFLYWLNKFANMPNWSFGFSATPKKNVIYLYFIGEKTISYA